MSAMPKTHAGSRGTIGRGAARGSIAQPVIYVHSFRLGALL